MPATILSTRESRPLEPPPTWARAIHVPSRRPWRGFSREWARLIRHHAQSADVIIVANAMFMPAVEMSGTRLPMIWDTNECQTLHYERLDRTASNISKQIIWWGLERWAATRCTVAVAIGASEALEWKRIHSPLRDKLMTVDHAAYVPAITCTTATPRLKSRWAGHCTGRSFCSWHHCGETQRGRRPMADRCARANPAGHGHDRDLRSGQ